MIDGVFIRSVLNTRAIHPIKTINGVCVAELRETDPSAGLKKVEIYGVSKDAVVVKLDAGLPPADILAVANGQHRRCDYLIITEYKQRRVLVYVDLKTAKSGVVKTGYVQKQFRGGVCMVRYIDAIMDIYRNRKDFFSSFDECHFVVFYRPFLQKLPSRPPKYVDNTHIENFMKYPNPFRPKISELVGM